MRTSLPTGAVLGRCLVRFHKARLIGDKDIIGIIAIHLLLHDALLPLHQDTHMHLQEGCRMQR